MKKKKFWFGASLAAGLLGISLIRRQRRLNGLDDPDFLFHGVAESNLDNSTWHCD